MNTTTTKEARSNAPAILSDQQDELTRELIQEIMELTPEERKELMKLWKNGNR